MRKVWIWAGRVLSVILIAVILMAIPVISRGYQMYREAIAKKSLTEAVEQIRSSENYVTLQQVPEIYLQTLIQSEDKRFYWHQGIDPLAIVRAVYNDIKAGAYVQGGSTITQQLAKNLYFSFGKTMDRKAAELFVVHDLEANYTKDEILELYINDIYFGNGQYGIKAAANYYYGLAPDQLNSVQIDQLVYTIKCPNYYNPEFIHPAEVQTIQVTAG